MNVYAYIKLRSITAYLYSRPQFDGAALDIVDAARKEILLNSDVPYELIELCGDDIFYRSRRR